MDQLTQDLRFAARALLKHRSTTLIAILCLALGIGANTAIFSVVHAVLLAGLPYRDPATLVRVYETANFGGTKGVGAISVPNLVDWRQQNTVFDGLAAFSLGTRDLGGGHGEPERVRTVWTTANLFQVVGGYATLGRTFGPDEDQPGKPPVVILSDRFWRRRFGADPSVVNSTVTIDNVATTVIGVMPAGFEFPIAPVPYDVWMPLVWTDFQKAQRGNHWMQGVARLKPGIDSAAATANMTAIAKRLEELYPGQNQQRGVQINSMAGALTGRIRTPLLTLLGAVGMVLLIACANVANLLLARASGRRREVAIRTALGAERGRLIRQFLTESVLLALVAGTLGLAVAYFGLKGILIYAGSALPRATAVGLDPLVLAFAALASVVTGVGFGIVPALRMSRPDVQEDLTDTAGRSGTGRHHHRTLDALMVGEVAVSLMLAIGAGLLVRGFVALVSTDSGLTPDHVLTFHVGAPAGQYGDSVRYNAFYRPLLERLEAIPGVEVAATTNILPIQNTGMNGNFTIVGRPQESDVAKQPFAEFRIISRGYFKALGIAIKQGREFTDQDALDAQGVIIANDEFVRRYMPGESALGKQILPWGPRPATIVGVVTSVRQSGLDQAPRPELYVPAPQTPWATAEATYVLRTRVDPNSIVPAVRQAVHEIGPSQPVYLVSTMSQVVSDSLKGRKLNLTLLAIFAGLAVVLSAAGVYGVTTYGVAQRRREIGIRMALGASARDVLGMVLTAGARRALLGVVIGLAGAWAATRVLTSMLYQVDVRDPLTFGLVPFVIVAVAIAASVIPALRASRVDPVVVLKSD